MTMFVNTQNHGTLNMRAAASQNAAVLAQIPYKTQLEVETVDNTWSKTSYNNKEGYVMTKFLSAASTITKADIQAIYNSLQLCLKTIEEIL